MQTGVSFSSGLAVPSKFLEAADKSSAVSGRIPLPFTNLAYLGWGASHWPELTLPRPAWSLPAFPIHAYAPAAHVETLVNSEREHAELSNFSAKPARITPTDSYCYAALRQHVLNNAAHPVTSLSGNCDVVIASSVGGERWAARRADDHSGRDDRESPSNRFTPRETASTVRTNSCHDCPAAKLPRSVTPESSPNGIKIELDNTARPSTSDDSGHERSCDTERPFLKFGVRAILAKSHVRETPAAALPMTAFPASRFPDHVTIPSTTDFPAASIASQSCSYVPHNSFLAPHGPLVTHIPRPMLPWLPVTIRGKNRRGMLRRAVFSDGQRKSLEKKFQQHKYIGKPDRKKLAAKLGLKDSQVKIWFQNRRMKWRNSKEKQILSSMDFTKKEDMQSIDDVSQPDESMTSLNSQAVMESSKGHIPHPTEILISDDVACPSVNNLNRYPEALEI